MRKFLLKVSMTMAASLVMLAVKEYADRLIDIFLMLFSCTLFAANWWLLENME